MLREDLKSRLGSWRAMLPAAWRARVDGIELPFDAVPRLPGGAIWPASVFRAFHDLAPARVRAVIFGNDPYTKVAQATGRSFEQGDITDWKAQIRTRRVSPSLRSIVQAAVLTRFPGVPRTGITPRIAAGDIALPAQPFPGWAAQGVLWLNRTLTFSTWDDAVRRAHEQLWAPFTARVLRILLEEAKTRTVVFVLWGGTAQDLEKQILAASAPHATIVKAGHPMLVGSYFAKGNPLSAINAALGPPAIAWL
jgi:uracil-DNA glycosylase